ncbi:hypothetical protein A9996_19310 [Gelidibacter algens]|nr:hypothetical protein A9996_19310 [Gelidibacter algens]
MLVELTKDLANPKTKQAFKNYIKGNDDGMYSYLQLAKAGRTELRTSVEALQAFTKLQKNEKLIKLGVSKGDLAGMLKKLEASPNTTFTDFDKVLNKLNKSYNDPLKGGNSKGAHGVLKTLDDEFDNLLKGNSIKFEKRVENARDINSMSAEDLTVELLIDGQIIKRIEVKYCTNCVDEKTIIKQFIERDLYNATNINQIKWKVYGQDFTKSDLQTILSSADGKKALEGLGVDKVKQLLPKDEFLTNQNFVQRILENLERKEVFNLIFK